MADELFSTTNSTSTDALVQLDASEDQLVAAQVSEGSLSTGERLSAGLELVWADLASRAASADFLALLTEVFGATGADAEAFALAAQDLSTRLASGDRLGLRFELETAAEMGNAAGAYAVVGDDGVSTIYINGDWLTTASDDLLQRVLIEEIGHSFDTQLNGSTDTAGDEGELFANLYTGTVLTDEQRALISAENDQTTLIIDGQTVLVEEATSAQLVDTFTEFTDLANGAYNGTGANDFGDLFTSTTANSAFSGAGANTDTFKITLAGWVAGDRLVVNTSTTQNITGPTLAANENRFTITIDGPPAGATSSIYPLTNSFSTSITIVQVSIDYSTSNLAQITLSYAVAGPNATVQATNSNTFKNIIANSLAFYSVSDNPTNFGASTSRQVQLFNNAAAALPVTGGTTSVNVAAINDAPVLNVNFIPALTSVLTSSGVPVGGTTTGQLVSWLIDGTGQITDPDSTLTGIAITAVNTAAGTLYYSTNGGSSWTAVGTVTAASALLLRSTDRLYLASASTAGSTSDALTFKAWDQSTGTLATKVDTTVAGSTAFSTSTDTVSVLISNPAATNNAPVLTNTAVTLSTILTTAAAPTIGSTVASTLVSDLVAGISDTQTASQSGSPITGIAITALNAVATLVGGVAGTALGTLWYSTNNGGTWQQVTGLNGSNGFLLLADANTRLFYQPPANAVAGSVSPFTFRGWDATTGTAGTLATITIAADGAFSSATDTADLQLIAGSSVTFTENGTSVDPLATTYAQGNFSNQPTANLVITVSDVVAGDVLTLGNGTGTPTTVTLNNSLNATALAAIGNYSVVYNSSTGVATITCTGLSAANKAVVANGITFINSRDYLTNSSRIITLLDNGATLGAGQVYVVAVNDAPVLADTALSYPAITSGNAAPVNGQAVGQLVTGLTGGITDPDSVNPLPEGIAVTSVASGFTLYYTTNGGTTWNVAPNPIPSGNALLLADDAFTRIYLQASGAAGATDALIIRAWDRSTGTSGTIVSLPTTPGGTTAFSAATDVVSVTINANNTPVVDLNGSVASGIDRTASFTEGGGAVAFTSGGTNFSDLNNTNVARLNLVFDLANFSNGTDEKLIIGGTTYNLTTAFANGASGSVTVSGTTYAWSSSVSGGTTTIGFTGPSAAVLTTPQVEALLDAFQYQNTSTDPTSGIGRVFNLSAVDAQASDGTSAIAKFTISVSGVNNPPTVAAAIPDQIVSEGLPFAYQFSASTFTDLDGDTLTYTAKLSDGNPLPAWVQFNAAERRFYGAPPKNSPDLTIALTATDGSGASATDTFVLAPVDYNVNPISSSNPGFAYLKLTTAYQLVNGGTFSSTGYYEEETNDFQTAPTPLQGTNFVFYQEGAATFSGNNVPGWLAYNDVNGNIVRIRGEATRPIKSPSNQFEGVYLWVEDPDADGPYNPATPTATDPDGSTDNTAYVLSFGSFFYGNQVEISSSDRVDAALNGLLDQPALAISSATITEGGQLQFTVTRTGDLTKSSTVDYTTAILTGNTASASDFTAASGTLTFANGESSKTILVNTTNDSFFELSETLSVQLTNASGARIDVDTAIGTIIDNDPIPAFSVSDAGNLEGNKITFTVTRSSNTLLTQTVNWATAFDATGTYPADASDFVGASGVLTFGAGETSKTVVIDTINDLVQEQKFETFNLILSEPTNGATIADGTGLGVIQDDEGTSYYSVANVTRNEADGTITFTVSRTQLVGEVQTLSYNFATKSGDATVAASNGTGVDVFGTLSGTLSFATNELSKTVVLDIVDDSISEADEKFYITLSNLSSLINSGAIATEFSSYNGDGTLSTGVSLSGGLPTGVATSTYAVGTVIDNDSASYSVTGGTIEEGGNIVFTITLNKASSSTQTVDYTTAILPGNTATAPDFTANQGSLTFAPGQTSKTVTIATIDDSINEATETFSLQLSNPVGGATIATGTATGTITDNDKPTLSISSPTVVEGSIAPDNYNYAYFSITLNAPGDSDVTFALDLLNGTGTAGTDAYNIEVYNGSSWVSYTTGGTVTIPAGNVVQRVRVRVTDDGISDNNETVLLQATGITNTANNPATATGTLTILDTNVSLSCTGGPEGLNASYLVTATLLQPSIGQTVVTVKSVADGSTIGTITIANGETQGTLTTPANNGEDPYQDPSSLQVYSSSAIVTSPEGDQYSIPMLNGSTNPVTGNTADTIDPTTLSFSGTSVNEGGTQTITASLTNPAAEALTLTLSRQGQTLSIPIAAGASSGTTTFTASDAEFNHLSAGATQSVSFAVSVSTNTFEDLQYSGVLNLTVTGVNDPPSINPGQNSGSVTEDGSYDNGAPLAGVPSVSQTLSASDVDDNYVHTWSIAGTPSTTYGTMTIGAQSGVWTYALNNADPDTQALREGDSVTQSYTAQVADEFGASATQTITVTITGTNDAPVITTAAGGNAGSVTEDGSFDNGDPWTFTPSVSGTLSATDVDQPSGHTWSLVGTPSTTYGTMTIDPTTAVWTYNLDNTDADTQGLREGESVTQSYTAQVLDEFGATATQTITVTITGTNDAPVIQETAQVGSVTEAGSLDDGTAVAGTSSASGTFTATDVDTLAVKTWSIAGTPSTTYGTMTIGAQSGVWTYALNNADPDTEALREGDSVTQTYTVQVTDEFGASDTETVTITITGTNDVPVITTAAGGNAGSVTEDGSFDNGDPWTFTPSVSGTLSATDVDQPSGHTWSLVGTPSTTYGTMTIDPTTAVWTYNLDNTEADTQGLREGESVTQSYTAQVLDEFGATATQTITVTITGTNDAPVIQESAQTGTVSEAGSLDDGTAVAGTSSASGTFTATDVDTLAVKTWSIAGTPSTTYGTMTIGAQSGVWTYALNNADPDTEALREGDSVTQTYTVQVTDEFGASDTETVTITITGTNDVPVITTAAGGNAGSVTEDGSFDNGDPWTFTPSVSGTLSATDVDQPSGHTWSLVGTPSTTYGTMTIDPTTAVWTYNLDNTEADTQGLREGESVTQSYTAQVLDEFGATATQTITVTITGTNDVPVITTAAGGNAGSVTEDGSFDNGDPWTFTPSVSGTLSATDVDQPSGHTWSLVGTPSTTYGTMTIDPTTAVWTYNLDNTEADTQGLREGESVTQSYTAQVLDEFGATATQTITVTITGTNDAPVIQESAQTGTVSEAGSLDDGTAVAGTSSASGTFTATDVDTLAVKTWSIAGTPSTTYGTMTIGAQSGVWTYALNNADPDTEALREGDSVTQTYTVQVTDEFGASDTEVVTITITGTNDVPVITTAAGGNAGSVTEDGSFDNGDPWTFTPSVSGTLSATDVDQPSGHTWSLVGTPSTTYGTMTIDPTTAVWTYNLDNTEADTQGLREGESVTQSYTAQVLDEFGATATQTITVTITGTNDAPVIQESAQTGTVSEAGSLDDGTAVAGTSSASGTFTATDVDTLAVKTWSIAGTPSTTYGTMTIGAQSGVWTYALNNADPDTEALREGDSVTQTYTVQVTDEFGASDTETVTITITGTNDVPVITTAAGGNAGSVTEDGSFDNGDPWTFTPSVSGTLSATDVDQPSGHTWSLVGTPSTTYGTMTIDPTTAVWTYNLDNTEADTQGLREGESVTQSYTAQVLDEFGATATQTITVTITGTNDVPVITTAAGGNAGSVTEDGSFDNGDPWTFTPSVSGTLSATDVDQPSGHTWSLVGTPSTTYGTMTIDPTTAVWTYNLDNTEADTQGLREGESVTQSYTAQVLDEFGATATQTITVTITGTNDAPVIQESAQTGTVSEAGSLDDGTAVAGTSSASGTFTATDVDTLAVKTWSIAGTPSTTYGTMTIGAQSGVWTYALNNADPDTEALREGDSVTQTYTVQVTDEFGASDTEVVTITITGTNDVPVITTAAGGNAGSVTEDGSFDNGDPWTFTPSVSGTLSATDVDQPSGHTWSLVGTPSTTYGTMTIDPTTAVWTYNLDNTEADTQGLREGESVTQSYTAQVLDEFGATATQTITVTITGTNDAPVIQESAQTGTVSEAGSLDDGTAVAGTSSASGTFTATDVDTLAVKTWSIAGTPSTTYGTMTIGAQSGVWTYALNNADPDTEALREGDSVTQTYTVQVTDEFGASDTETVTITITGTNDVPVITTAAGGNAGSVTEDGSYDDGTFRAGSPTVGGTLSVTDVDQPSGHTWSLVGAQSTTYGSMAINATTGVWTYNLDNADADTQGLREGESVTQSYTAQVLDEFGATATQTITVTITGTNDAPVIQDPPQNAPQFEAINAISSAFTGSVSEDGTDDAGNAVAGTSSVSGTLTATDVDANDHQAWSLVGAQPTTYGTMTIGAQSGVWTYTLDNNDPDTQALREGQSVTQTYTAQVMDDFGATDTQTITITITGSNDAPTINAGGDNGSVVEAGNLDNGAVVQGIPTVSGTLTVTDVDQPSGHTWSLVGAQPSTYGSMAINATTGVWTYNLDNADLDTQGIAEGESQTQTYTAQVTDAFGASATQTVTITITGTNDMPDIGVQTGDKASHSFTETTSAPGSASPGLTTTGSLSVRDLDISDTVSTVKDGVSFAGSGNAFRPAALDSTAALAMLTLTAGNSANPAAGNALNNLSWSFNSGSQGFDYLAAGEVQQLTYTLKATDNNGASDTQTVVISVTGTNDVAVISGTSIGEVIEKGGSPNGGQNDSYAELYTGFTGKTDPPAGYYGIAGGTLSVVDLDHDQQFFTPTQTPLTGTYGSFTINQNGVWSYTLDETLAEPLGKGESTVEAFLVYSKDSSASQTVSVMVYGADDSARLTVSSNSTSVHYSDRIDKLEITAFDPDGPASAIQTTWSFQQWVDSNSNGLIEGTEWVERGTAANTSPSEIIIGLDSGTYGEPKNLRFAPAVINNNTLRYTLMGTTDLAVGSYRLVGTFKDADGLSAISNSVINVTPEDLKLNWKGSAWVGAPVKALTDPALGSVFFASQLNEIDLQPGGLTQLAQRVQSGIYPSGDPLTVGQTTDFYVNFRDKNSGTIVGSTLPAGNYYVFNGVTSGYNPATFTLPTGARSFVVPVNSPYTYNGGIITLPKVSLSISGNLDGNGRVTAWMEQPVSLTGSETSKDYLIATEVGGKYYQRSNTLDDTVVTYAKTALSMAGATGPISLDQGATGQTLTIGSGTNAKTLSAGGSGVTFSSSLNVESNKTGTNLKGKLLLNISSAYDLVTGQAFADGKEHAYVITTNAWNSFGMGSFSSSGVVQYQSGNLIGKANGIDTTTGLSLGGNLNVQINFRDYDVGTDSATGTSTFNGVVYQASNGGNKSLASTYSNQTDQISISLIDGTKGNSLFQTNGFWNMAWTSTIVDQLNPDFTRPNIAM